MKRIGKVTYEFELPSNLVAYASSLSHLLLKKCVGDPTSLVQLESMAGKDSLYYEDVPIKILTIRLEG